MSGVLVATVAGVLGVAAWFALRPVSSIFVDRSRVDVAMWAAITGAMTALAGWRFGPGWIGTTVLVAVVGLSVLTEIDLRTHRLPREISYPLIGATTILVTIIALVEGRSQRLVEAMVGATIATAVLLLLHLLSRGGLGDGDVRLAPALGILAFVGGVESVWSGLLLAFVGAGLAVAVLMVLGRASRQSTIPFGPFLIGGAVISTFVNGG